MKSNDPLAVHERRVAREGIKGLLSLPEDEMRRRQLSSWLIDDLAFKKRALFISEEIFEQAANGGLDGRTLFKAALLALLSLHSSTQLNLMVQSKNLGLEFCRSTLWSSLIPTKGVKNKDHPDMITDERGRTLTLGERRALARRPSTHSIQRLINDSDHIVVKHLLQNPRLTETIILRIVTHRPQNPMTLYMIFEHPIWGQRTEIQKALTLNPSSPLPIRCSLVSILSLEECEDTLREVNIPLPLKAALNRQVSSLTL
jgi:hypothetical protein